MNVNTESRIELGKRRIIPYRNTKTESNKDNGKEKRSLNCDRFLVYKKGERLQIL